MTLALAAISGLVLAFASVALYLWALAPRHGRAAGMRPFEERFVAHRGLFDNDSSAPENSLPAFAAAVRAGYGIELDVQRTADGALVSRLSSLVSSLFTNLPRALCASLRLCDKNAARSG